MMGRQQKKSDMLYMTKRLLLDELSDLFRRRLSTVSRKLTVLSRGYI